MGARVSISTPFLEVPWLEYDELVATLRYFANVTDFGESGMILVNCADVTSLPAIGLHMGDVSVIVTGQEYTTASVWHCRLCLGCLSKFEVLRRKYINERKLLFSVFFKFCSKDFHEGRRYPSTVRGGVVAK